jgi:hypothetical protein
VSMCVLVCLCVCVCVCVCVRADVAAELHDREATAATLQAQLGGALAPCRSARGLAPHTPSIGSLMAPALRACVVVRVSSARTALRSARDASRQQASEQAERAAHVLATAAYLQRQLLATTMRARASRMLCVKIDYRPARHPACRVPRGEWRGACARACLRAARWNSVLRAQYGGSCC